ncbi:SidA/IucD/PvdA family monooxygenase [Yeosuana marina]|uniref:SidA/IucD/PvdA family monooxygenase n=1 Tax=Yeosuana marina TaxID=1565536 RepID=UPI0030C89549
MTINNNSHKSDDANFYDMVGVGFGPSNIALAIAHQELGSEYTLKFLEAEKFPDWQSGVKIPGSDIQHNPLRDFVTPRNPRSQYGYLSYLQEMGRLMHYLNLDSPFPPRSDYAKYVQWVAKKFNNQVSYNSKVKDISIVGDNSGNNLFFEIKTNIKSYKSKAITFAPGRSLNIPPVFKSILGKSVFHFTKYNMLLQKYVSSKPNRIAVIGGSQSAVEIILDLHKKFPNAEIISIHRKFNLVLKDTSPFTEDLLLPENVDYFYNSSEKSKKDLISQVIRSNYGSVDEDILKELYYVLYENRVNDNNTISLYNNKEVIKALDQGHKVQLEIRDVHRNSIEKLSVDAVVLGTGFRNFGTGENEELLHPLLNNIKNYYQRKKNGTFRITRDYQLVPISNELSFPKIYLNGLCESTHGLADAGSFSHLSLRAMQIESSIVKNFLIGSQITVEQS